MLRAMSRGTPRPRVVTQSRFPLPSWYATRAALRIRQPAGEASCNLSLGMFTRCTRADQRSFLAPFARGFDRGVCRFVLPHTRSRCCRISFAAPAVSPLQAGRSSQRAENVVANPGAGNFRRSGFQRIFVLFLSWDIAKRPRKCLIQKARK